MADLNPSPVPPASLNTASKIPQDVLNIEQLLGEYGFTPDNSDPLLIHQILAIVNESAMHLLGKADILRDAMGSKDPITDKSFQLILNKHPHDHLEEIREQFILQSRTVNSQSTIPDHPATTPLQSLPLPTALDTPFYDLQDDYSILLENGE